MARTTCPSCSNRCADGGQTGLRVRLVFSCAAGLQTPAAVWQVWKLDRGGGRKATEAALSVLPPCLYAAAANREFEGIVAKRGARLTGARTRSVG
jgi:hypothetical protein